MLIRIRRLKLSRFLETSKLKLKRSTFLFYAENEYVQSIQSIPNAIKTLWHLCPRENNRTKYTFFIWEVKTSKEFDFEERTINSLMTVLNDKAAPNSKDDWSSYKWFTKFITNVVGMFCMDLTAYVCMCTLMIFKSGMSAILM